MSVLEFVEGAASRKVTLTARELRELRRVERYLHVADVSASGAEVGPRQGYVGSATLSTDTRIVVRPKAPVANILHLLTLAYRTSPLPPAVAETLAEEAGAVDWLAVLLVSEIERLLAHGLRRGYVEVIDELPYVRGRLELDATRLLLRPGQLTCRFADFVADTAENRVLRGTLELLRESSLHLDVQVRVADSLRSFQEVAFIRPSLRLLDGIHLSRLNRHYGPALALCRLFLEGAGVEDQPGDVTIPSFFVPMERVFERALFHAFQDEHLGRVRHEPLYTPFIALDGTPALPIKIKPDIVIGPRLHPNLVVDAKWTSPFATHHGALTYKNDHIYQLVTYCHALRCPGVLVYPRYELAVAVDYELDGVRVGIRTVELSVPKLGGLRQLARDLLGEAAANQATVTAA